ncbi:MAG: NMD3-related protein [Candidatus Helarchaeota archaeon]
MDIISKKGIRFCIECGKKNVILVNNRCKDCYIKSSPIVRQKSKSNPIKICKECYRYFFKTWKNPIKTEFNDYINEILFNMIENFIEIDENTELEFIFDITPELLWTNRKFTLQIIAKKFSALFNDELIDSIRIPIRVEFTRCDTCSNIKRKYYEAVINISKKNGFLNSEYQKFLQIIENEIKKLRFSRSDAYLSKYTFKKNNIKFYFGSKLLAKNVARIISSKWHAIMREYTRSEKKDTKHGKKSERFIINIKISDFSIGDIISIQDQLFLIRSIKNNLIYMINLKTKASKVQPLKKEFNYNIIRTKDNLDHFVVVSTYDDIIQIMDEKTFRIYEVMKSNEFTNILPQSKLSGIIYEDQIYILDGIE